jgi:hypothetical protein
MTARVVTVVCACIALLAGCQKSATTGGTAMGAVKVCDDCGQVKGKAACCAPGAATCASCGMVKGSIGCCRIDKGGGDVEICTSCGHFTSSDACCRPGQETCAKCGLVKGSPGCCKLRG